VSGPAGDFEQGTYIAAPDFMESRSAKAIRYEQKVVKRIRQVCPTIPQDKYLRLVLKISKNGKPYKVEIIDTENCPQITPDACAMVSAISNIKFGKQPKNYSERAFHMSEF
jgi:hypothetical protein